MISIANLIYCLVVFCVLVGSSVFITMFGCVLLSLEDDIAVTVVKYINGFILMVLAFIGFMYLTGYIC